MHTKRPDSKLGGNRASLKADPLRRAQQPSGPPATGPGAWVSQAIGLDSWIPTASAQSPPTVEHVHYEKVSIQEAVASHNDGRPAAKGAAPRLRPPSVQEPLEDRTAQWLTQLPEATRPLELARLFPRIANNLSALWPNPRLRDPYLNRLLMDSRDGAREGFPAAVAAEIAALLGSAELPVAEHPWGHLKSAP